MVINISLNRIEREVRRNVEVNPKHPAVESIQHKNPAVDSIHASERFVLDGWTSVKFQLTGGAVAVALAVMMLTQGPPSHM